MDLEYLLAVYIEPVKLSVLVVNLEMLAVRCHKSSHRIDLENPGLKRCVRVELSVLVLSHRLALLVRYAFFSGTVGSDISDLLVGDGDPALTCFRKSESVENLEQIGIHLHLESACIELVLYEAPLPLCPLVEVVENDTLGIGLFDKARREISCSVTAVGALDHVALAGIHELHRIFGTALGARISDVLETRCELLALVGSGILADPVIFVVIDTLKYLLLKFLNGQLLYLVI